MDECVAIDIGNYGELKAADAVRAQVANGLLGCSAGKIGNGGAVMQFFLSRI